MRDNMTRNRKDWGVIFDMDGVLVDSAPAHFESWQRLAREERCSITREQFASGFGRQNRDIIPEFFGPVSAERLAAIAHRKEFIYRELVRAKVPAVEGAGELIAALAAERIPLAIGSAGPRQNMEKMHLAGSPTLKFFKLRVNDWACLQIDASSSKTPPPAWRPPKPRVQESLP
jgi:beta-phosphoglucomutase-like phosphatase (HAD superfamily)